MRKAGYAGSGSERSGRGNRRGIRRWWRNFGVGGAIFLALMVPPPARAGDLPVCQPDNANQVRLDISVSGMRSAKGSLVISVYPDQPQHFLDGKYKLGKQVLPITLPVTHACFVMPKPGWYAVAMFDDANNNGHFDTNAFGIPVEGFGFSNNPKLSLGPPSLEQVRFFAHRGDNSVVVHIMYY